MTMRDPAAARARRTTIHCAPHEAEMLKRLLCYLPFERAFAGGPVPAGRLFVLLAREMCREALSPDMTKDPDEETSAELEAGFRLSIYEQRLDERLLEQRKAFAVHPQAPEAKNTVEEEHEAVRRVRHWLALALKMPSDRHFLETVASEPGLLEGIAAGGTHFLPRVAQARHIVRSVWWLVRKDRMPLRDRLQLAARLYRLLLRPRKWREVRVAVARADAAARWRLALNAGFVEHEHGPPDEGEGAGGCEETLAGAGPPQA